jgi:dTDP-4-dehydrorhamnose 3,5-epimerase
MERPKIIDVKKFVDDRGILTCSDEFTFNDVKRFYMVENHDINFIRAWHGHEKEEKYVHVISGAILIGLVPFSGPSSFPGESGLLFSKNVDFVEKHILSSVSPKILYIPPNYFNGFMNLERDTKIMFYSTSTLEESKSDDIRLDYNHWNIWEKNYR